jgi:DNA (cytosine-5)-methyltransferase 1
MMFKPLTENLGTELLMSFLGDFHARTLAQQEKGGELLEAEVQCGNTWRELLAKYNPNTASWKTAQCSLLEDLEQSLETWPRWGSMRNGECFRQPMLVQITAEKEYGLSERIPNNLDFFHTPCTTGLDGGSNSRKALKKRMEKMPTPLSSDYKGVQRMRDNHQNDLAAVVGGPVNPTFSEWLMGWPLEWTDLKPLETDKSLYVQQQLGDS